MPRKPTTLESARGTCGSCKHWEIYNSAAGCCHRLPPVVFVSTDSEGEEGPMTVFPITEPTDWCGEFRGKQ